MRLKECIILIVLILFINNSNQQYLSLNTYKTQDYPIVTGTWRDILGVQVECPHGGLLKNFVLRKNSEKFWYEFQCYSSLEDASDEGEPIIKGLTLYSTYRYSITIQNNIRTLDQYPVECWVDYGLMSFLLYNDNGILRREAVCHGVKPSTTVINVKTGYVKALATTIDGLVGITVGSTATEDDEHVGYPLRGFKYNIDVSSSKEKPKVSYIYAYSVLRNMKKVKEASIQALENLKNGNTQKN